MSEILLSSVPKSIADSFVASQDLLEQMFKEALAGATKYGTRSARRKYLAIFLKGASLLSAVLIAYGVFPQQMAFVVVLIYGTDSLLSNGKQLVAWTQIEKAYSGVWRTLAWTHEIEQAKLKSIADEAEQLTKIAALNFKLVDDARNDFLLVQKAIDNSDMMTLQALSLDQDQLKSALTTLKSRIVP